MPAGAIEPGEAPARPLRIIGVFGGEEGFRFSYSNGDAVEYTVVLFECEKIDGELGAHDQETVKLQYFAPDKMPSLPVKYSREMFVQSRRETYFDWDEKWLEDLK